MSEPKNKIKLFEDKQVRHIWDEENEKYWFSIFNQRKWNRDKLSRFENGGG